MDGNHGIGCTLVGLAMTLILVRMFWMSSPPFNTMSKSASSATKRLLIIASVLMIGTGVFLISQPLAPEAVQRMAEEGYRFH